MEQEKAGGYPAAITVYPGAHVRMAHLVTPAGRRAGAVAAGEAVTVHRRHRMTSIEEGLPLPSREARPVGVLADDTHRCGYPAGPRPRTTDDRPTPDRETGERQWL